jgi:hypothetical protein
MSDKEWNAQAFAKHIIEGVGGMNDCERHELAVFPLGDRVAAVEWTLRCLANPECEGSAEAFAAIAEKRLGKCVWRQDDEGNWFADIRNNGAVPVPDVNPHNERQDGLDGGKAKRMEGINITSERR